MLVIMVPAAGWNTPGADYSRTDCCFKSGCWDNKPGSACTFTAKINTAWDWQMKQWRSYDNPDGHIFLLQNGIRILQEKGYDNWAAYLADENNFQALADGASWADQYKGRWWVTVYVTALLGVIEIPVYKGDPTCAAGWDHYYNSFTTDSDGKGLECKDASIITQYFLDAFCPIITAGAISGSLTILQFLPAVGFIFKGIKLLQDVGMLGMKVQISPAIQASYPSAAYLASEHFDLGVKTYTATHDLTYRYWEHRSAQYDSLFQAGWSTHFAQDVCVIYHQYDIYDTLQYYHADFEDQATGLGDPNANPAWHVHGKDWKVATGYETMSVADICREGALAVNTPYYWEKAKSDNPATREVALQQGLKVSEQVTAAMLAKYMINLGIPKYVPDFKGAVVDSTNGIPVAGAYVFYREKLGYSGDPDVGGIKTFIDQERPWDYTITDFNGNFALDLQEGRTYFIRAELPGYYYTGYISTSAKEIMSKTIIPKTVEFTRPLAGGKGALTDISYNLYITPRMNWAVPVTPINSGPMFYNYAGPDPSLSLGASVSSQLRRDLTDAVMTVRADTAVLAAQAPGATYPLTVPDETYIEIEVANLLNIGTAKTLQSSQQIETVLASTETTWAQYRQIVRDPTAITAFNPALAPVVPITVSPDKLQLNETLEGKVRWQYSVSPDFATSADTLKLDPLVDGGQASVDTGYAPAAIGTLIESGPKEQVVLPDGNVTFVPLFSYSFGSGNMIHGDGQPLAENHLGRIPAANAKIKVTLVTELGCIGPDFTVIPPKNLQIQYPGGSKPAAVIEQNTMQPVFNTPVPTPKSTDSTATSLTMQANEEGVAAFVLKSGSQAGKIKLYIDVIDNPGATGIKPHLVQVLVVQPPIMKMNKASTVTLPSLGVVTPKQSLAATYLASFNGNDVTMIDTGMDLQVTEAKDGRVLMKMIQMRPISVISTPVTVESIVPGRGEPPSGWFDAIVDGILTIPKKIGELFGGGEPKDAAPADGVRCDDGNACTINDVMIGGVCQSGDPLNCDDRNPATEDWCDPEVGCHHEDMGGGIPPDGERCDDGNACTINDMMIGGVCQGGGQLNCDDNNPRTEDVCDPAVGCLHEDMSGGAPAGGTDVVCPRDCECLTDAEADAKFMDFVQCLDNPCGYFTPPRGEPVPKYCYRSMG